MKNRVFAVLMLLTFIVCAALRRTMTNDKQALPYCRQSTKLLAPSQLLHSVFRKRIVRLRRTELGAHRKIGPCSDDLYPDY